MAEKIFRECMGPVLSRIVLDRGLSMEEYDRMKLAAETAILRGMLQGRREVRDGRFADPALLEEVRACLGL